LPPDAPDAADAELTKLVLGSMPFARLLGIEMVMGTPEEARGRLAWREELCTAGGVLHGGAVMALADAVGALCAFLNLPEGAATATIESKTNFFSAVRSGHVEARSRPLHRGRTTIVVETDVVGDDERRVARVTQTQAIL
jgi:1,4-dihydroxy-2-naphthoyl-CoA hydrolase